jgi:hypothetical protein
VPRVPNTSISRLSRRNQSPLSFAGISQYNREPQISDGCNVVLPTIRENHLPSRAFSAALPHLGSLVYAASERARPRNSSRDTDMQRRCGCSSRGEPGTCDGPRSLGGVQPGPTCAQAGIPLVIGVKALKIDMTLATELSNALRPDNGA